MTANLTILNTMTHPKQERSFVMIKPDGVQRSLIGDIISRFERAGLKLVAAKFVMANEDQCWKHYNKDDAWFLIRAKIWLRILKPKDCRLKGK